MHVVDDKRRAGELVGDPVPEDDAQGEKDDVSVHGTVSMVISPSAKRAARSLTP
jgi:hypothetical protein